MGFLDRLFRRRGGLTEARRAELRGDLPRAIELLAEKGKDEEMARVMILRGDAEPDPKKRLQHYTQAAQAAPATSKVNRQARVKRVSLIVALARDAAVSAATREELLAAARELEDLGEAERAAEAYALVHDTEGEARALAQAGQVERLETLLTAEQARTQGERQRAQAYGEIESLVLTGRRREALAFAEQLALEAPLDPSARERIQTLAARRVVGPSCRLLLSDRPLHLVIDDELVVGRTEGSLVIASAALSRKHLAIARALGGSSGFFVRDLGSRNGTRLRGMRVAGSLPVGEGLSLLLGGEVRVDVAPSAWLADAIDVDVGGERYVASLGPARLGVGSWRLERAADGWIELVSDGHPPAFRGDMAMPARTTLLVGDRISQARGGPAALQVLGGADTGPP